MSAWIEWKGGECPVSEDRALKVRHGDNSIDIGFADDFCWHNSYKNVRDIISYQLIDELDKTEGKA